MLAQGEGTFQERARRLGAETESAYVQEIVEFITGESDRSFLTPGG
jgi:UDP-N-acetylglucosamine acyltransferase